jgi:hypothetical protein
MHYMKRGLLDGGFGASNLLLVMVTVAVRLLRHCHEGASVLALGSDYKRGHGSLTGLADLPMSAFNYAVTAGGLCKEHMTSLCASTGVVNIGVYRGSMYILYKWMVSSSDRLFATATKHVI